MDRVCPPIFSPAPRRDADRDRRTSSVVRGCSSKRGWVTVGEPAHLVGDAAGVEHANRQRSGGRGHFCATDPGGAERSLPFERRALVEHPAEDLDQRRRHGHGATRRWRIGRRRVRHRPGRRRAASPRPDPSARTARSNRHRRSGTGGRGRGSRTGRGRSPGRAGRRRSRSWRRPSRGPSSTAWR